MIKKTIISEFFTTVSFSQMMQSLYLMSFWLYKLKHWKEKELFEEKLLSYINSFSLGGKDVWKADREKIISFYNWRSAIFHALKMIWVSKEDEVIVNAYNCVSVTNAVIQTWGKIVYSDIETETLSFNFEILKKNITKNTKVIIIQHTFWKQARDYNKIIDFAKQNNILVIEDCAHYIPLSQPFPPREKGVLKWDFAIFSTWRDKVISSVIGGFLLINNEKYFEKIEKIKEQLKIPSTSLILKILNYNIVWYLAYELYDFLKLWRIIIFLSRKLKLITEILTPNEKACNFDNFYLDFPNSLAYLALKELEKLDKYTKIRLENSQYYFDNLTNNSNKFSFIFLNLLDYNWFRFPILLSSEEEKNKLLKEAKKQNIILWTSWSWINLAPIWTNLEKAQYQIWSCPVAEDISKRILTLPNHKLITKKDLKRFVNLLNNFK